MTERTPLSVSARLGNRSRDSGISDYISRCSADATFAQRAEHKHLQ